MIYSNILECYSSNTEIVDEQAIQFKLLNESIDMQMSTLSIMNRSLLDDAYCDQVLTEAFSDKVKTITQFIRKIIDKFKSLMVKVIQYMVSMVGIYAVLIPKLGSYAFPISAPIVKLKSDGHLLSKVPKSLMGNIQEYSAKSEEVLESMLTKEYAEKFMLDICKDAFKPFYSIKSVDELNAQYIIEEDVIPRGAAGAVALALKAEANKCKKLISRMDSDTKAMCDSYNRDLDKIEKMLSATPSQDILNNNLYNKERAVKDELLLNVIKVEYAALFQSAGKLAICQRNGLNICGTRNMEFFNGIITAIKNGDLNLYKQAKGAYKSAKEAKNKKKEEGK